MAQQSGPTSAEGKAASSRNGQTDVLANLSPVGRTREEGGCGRLGRHLFHAIQPVGYLQHLAARRLVNSAWNMQRCQKLENLLMESIDGVDPLAHPEAMKTAALYQRYYLRFEGAYRANLRELERLQRLQIVQDVYFGDDNPAGSLHDVQLHQRFAKRNQSPKPTVDNLDEYLADRVANDPRMAEMLRKQHEARQRK